LSDPLRLHSRAFAAYFFVPLRSLRLCGDINLFGKAIQ